MESKYACGVISSNFEIDCSWSFDFDQILICKFESELFLALKLFVNEFLIIVSIGNVGRAGVAFVDAKFEISS